MNDIYIYTFNNYHIYTFIDILYFRISICLGIECPTGYIKFGERVGFPGIYSSWGSGSVVHDESEENVSWRSGLNKYSDVRDLIDLRAHLKRVGV